MIPVKHLRKDRSAMDSLLMAGCAILAACFIIVASIAIVGALQTTPETVSEVTVGDTVEVDYIGLYSNGWLFDTSNYTVASGDEYTKAFEFTPDDESDYGYLEFTVGDGTALTGFNDALLGMRVGETIMVTIDMAYGEVDAEDLVTNDINQTVDVFEEMTVTEFESYYGEAPYEGLTVEHPIYGWDVTVFYLDTAAGTVTVQNLPVVGDQYAAYGDPTAESPTGWYINVTSMNSTRISLVNLLSSSMDNNTMGTDADGETFYLYGVDDDTFTMKYDSEIIGRDLTFIITLISIS